MGQVLVDSDSLTAIGDAIRKKTNQVIKYKPAEMPAAINNINSLKLGGYKVNITQSDHQTIHVVQSTFSDQESSFTIEDHPTINISLTADPGYRAGNLNRTTFTFSNDVREVDIFATEATYSPNNITYNGNMNVFLFAISTNDTKAFNITTGSKKDNVSIDHYTNEAFVLTLADDGDRVFESLIVNYKNNFYNLDPNCKYKITTLKIGDTSLSETDISDGDPNISSTSTYTHINASIDKYWVKSVYKQCTGKELELSYVDSVSPKSLDDTMQNGTPPDDKDAYLGEQIANTLFTAFGVEDAPASTSELLSGIDTELGGIAFGEFGLLSDDEHKKFINDMTTFMTTFKKTNPTGFRTGNLVQGYYSKLQEIMQKYANNEAALNILKQYNPATNEQQHGLSRGFATLDFTNRNPDLFELTYWIDSSDRYGFLASLPGGNAYVLWLFYARYVAAELLMAQSYNRFAGFIPIFEPADPIISTIPVSITFTKVTQ